MNPLTAEWIKKAEEDFAAAGLPLVPAGCPSDQIARLWTAIQQSSTRLGIAARL